MFVSFFCSFSEKIYTFAKSNTVKTETQMNKIKQLFHLLSYLQYPLLVVGLFLIMKPLFRGFDYVVSNPEYLFQIYNYALIFLGLALGFASLQDSTKTTLKYERKIWRDSKKAKRTMVVTIFTMFVFLFAGVFGFIMKDTLIEEFAYGSIVLAVGLLGYLKLQMEMYENHSSDSLKKSKRTDSFVEK